MNKPTIKECFDYSGNMEQSTLFFHHYESQGWKVGKNPMKNWKSALTGWINRSKPVKTKMDIAVSNTDTDTISQFWVRMSQIYGHKWVSSYGEKPTKPWVAVIGRLSNQEIHDGIEQMLKNGAEWPPSLPEFRAMCVSGKSRLKAISNTITHDEVIRHRESTRVAREREMGKVYAIIRNY